MNFDLLASKIGPEFSPTLRKLCVFRNWTAILTAYSLRMKQDIDNLQMQWKLQGVSYIISERYEYWSTNGLKLRSFYLLSENSAFFCKLIAGLPTRISDHKTQLNFATR